MPTLSDPNIDRIAHRLLQIQETRKQAEKLEEEVKGELREAMLRFRTEWPDEKGFEFDEHTISYVTRKTAANKDRLLEKGVTEEQYTAAQGKSESMNVKVKP